MSNILKPDLTKENELNFWIQQTVLNQLEKPLTFEKKSFETQASAIFKEEWNIIHPPKNYRYFSSMIQYDDYNTEKGNMIQPLTQVTALN